MRSGRNQYPPLPGVAPFREAIAEHQRRFYGMELDPDTQVQAAMGATEAITAAVLGLCEPGDELIALDPTYDSYAAACAMADVRFVPVALHPPEWTLDPEELAAAVTERTRMVLLNTPHNPTGRVLTRTELEAVAAVCIERDLIAVTDEVYEHLTFDGREHIPLATLPGMAERTVTISSLGKTFSVTGWKTGWACGPAELVAGVRAAKQFLTFSGGTPFQYAGAAALRLGDEWFSVMARELQAKRDRLCAGLEAAGLTVLRPQGTYFANADAGGDATAFARALVERAGVVAIPTSVFSADPERLARYVRFAFCKRPGVIDAAAAQLAAHASEATDSRES
jgi:N-succinyldiaminopimelate aminotransferase